MGYNNNVMGYLFLKENEKAQKALMILLSLDDSVWISLHNLSMMVGFTDDESMMFVNRLGKRGSNFIREKLGGRRVYDCGPVVRVAVGQKTEILEKLKKLGLMPEGGNE